MNAFDRNLDSLGSCNGQDSDPNLCADGCGRKVEEEGQVCDVCRPYDGKFLASISGAVERAENKAKGAA